MIVKGWMNFALSFSALPSHCQLSGKRYSHNLCLNNRRREANKTQDHPCALLVGIRIGRPKIGVTSMPRIIFLELKLPQRVSQSVTARHIHPFFPSFLPSSFHNAISGKIRNLLIKSVSPRPLPTRVFFGLYLVSVGKAQFKFLDPGFRDPLFETN